MEYAKGLRVAMTEGIKNRYCTVTEAAKLLKVSRSTIWRWIEGGRLPAYRVGPKNIRIRRDELEMVITPARLKVKTIGKERDDIWVNYDPGEVREAITKTAGSWADIDTETLVVALYRAREEGSRPESRP